MANFGERYELISRIGSGDTGEVWLARDEELGNRPVAIKIIHPHVLPDEGDVARFERETRLVTMLDHPNIVAVYATGTYDDAPFMVMEYLKGHDLEKALPGADAEHVSEIARDICSGLAYAHRQGMLHRDIKPGNLFLCESGQVKITNCGLARAVGGTALSTTGVRVGTFAYRAPERWRGEPPSSSNDVWAAGCVLYRLISGRLPRVLPGAADYVAAAERGDPVPDLRDFAAAPDWLADPVMAMLAVDPAGRPSASDCVRLLSGARSPLSAGRRPRRDRVVLAASAAVLLLAAGSVTAWRLSSSRQAAELAVRSTAMPLAGRFPAGKAPAAAATASRSGSVAAPPPGAASAAAAFRAASPAASPATSSSAAPRTSLTTSPAGSISASPVSSAPADAVSPAPAGPVGSPPPDPVSSPPADPQGPPPATPPAGGSSPGTPATTTVPDVVGMTFSQAKQLLESDGFTVKGKHAGSGQVVTSMSPAGEAATGSKITVAYGTAVRRA